MEKKQTQRIIGILVVVALVIIIMPLLFGKNDAQTQEASNVSAPPLPDQQAATVTAENTAPQAPDAAPADTTAVATDAVATQPSAAAPDAAPVAQPVAATQPGVIQQPDTSAAAPAEASQPVAATPDIKKIDSTVSAAPAPQPNVNTSAPSDTNSASEAQKTSSTEITPDVAKSLNGPKESSIVYERPGAAEPVRTTYPPVVTVDKAPVVAQPQPVVENEVHVQKTRVIMHHSHKSRVAAVVAKNKKAVAHIGAVKTAWAVQMGSFKVKQNATLLASKLRAAGYKAFTREIKSAKGTVSTRVYVGPEVKLASASKLSSDVHHHFNMQGIVIPYKPFV